MWTMEGKVIEQTELGESRMEGECLTTEFDVFLEYVSLPYWKHLTVNYVSQKYFWNSLANKISLHYNTAQLVIIFNSNNCIILYS